MQKEIRMRKILLNGLQLSDYNTGVQYYTKNLYDGLESTNLKGVNIRLLRSQDLGPVVNYNNRVKRIFVENFSLLKLLRKNNFDLYHSPNYILPFFCNFPSVLTIHDLITLDYPDFCQTESVVYFRLSLSRSVKQASKIIAVSQTVKNDILRHFDIPEDKIKVIYHGLNPIFKKSIDESILKKHLLPGKYILFVGNIEPKKNLNRLIRAFDQLKKNTEMPHKLVIVGKKGWKYKSIFKTISELKIAKEIVFCGYVPEGDLPVIYSMADLFVFPSLYEGFGFPPLEAMACGVPVLASTKGALPEITGGNCLLVDPYQVDEIANGMHKILTDHSLKQKLISDGNKWVKQFSWEKAAKETLSVYEQTINEVQDERNC